MLKNALVRLAKKNMAKEGKKKTLNNFPLLLSWVAVPEVLEERLQLLKGEVGEVYSPVLGLLTQDPLLPADQQTVRLRVALEHVPAKMFSV